MKDFLNKLFYGGGVIFDLARWVILVGVILALLNTFWMTVFIVDGMSMEPKLHDKEVAVLQKNAYAGNRNPERGDIVVVQYPGDPEHKRYVKRVIGLPGENFSISNGKVYINGKELEELYISFDVATTPDGSWHIPDNAYFAMGDNRPNSNDSRYFGPIEKRFFVGKAKLIIFPRLLSLKDL